MKTIGLIGGTTWESTSEYYRIINQEVQKRLGGHNSAKILLHSFNFDELLELKYDVPRISSKISQVAQTLEKAGAHCIVICANTLHISAEEVQSRISIPILSIIDATAEEIKKDGYKKIGLIGTEFTMQQDFYRGKIEGKYDIETLVPDEKERQTVHGIIFNELCFRQIREESRSILINIIGKLKEKGAQGIILGCTELPLLIDDKEVDIKLYNTTLIHSKAAVKFAML